MMKEEQRNYEIDFLKFIFAWGVFFTHTAVFIDKNTTFALPNGLDWISVQFFFMVSEMLMVNSYKKGKMNSAEHGKRALNFVISKFKSIALEYWVSLGLCLGVYIYLTQYWEILMFRIPEFFAISEISSLTGSHNGPTWYISAMLICMLPLYYMLSKDEDFFLYVFAPLAGLLSYGYLFSENAFAGRAFNGLIVTTLIRAFSGLCMGVISWLICEKMIHMIKRQSGRILLTIVELFLWAAFFITLFTPEQKTMSLYCVMLLLPLALGISFSGKSYIAQLFNHKMFKKINSLSLGIYLNHWGDYSTKFIFK